MDVTYDSANRVYIKSNTATTMRFLWFLSALLLVLVVGLCCFVVFGRDDTQNYHWDEAGQFYYTLDDNEVTLVKYTDTAAESYAVPANVNYGGKNYPVKTIGAKAFANHASLTTVTIPDSVTEIVGDKNQQTGAFSGCVALTTLNLGSGVTRIGGYAFKNCLALTAVELPSSVQFIGDGAFQGCVALKKIALNSNGKVGADCFAECLSVETLQLADDVCLFDDVRRVLAGLSKLSTFEITENHLAYTVKSAGDGQCLLDATDDSNVVVVLGGAGASVPADVNQILDWAWGSRAADNLYVSSTVSKVGANSFDCVAICTDTTAKPAGWATEVPVNTQAQLITFTAANEHAAQAYIYHEDNQVVYPVYDDLFPGLETDKFIKWGNLVGSTCAAIYASGDATALDDLTAAKNVAAGYLADTETRLKFTVDFWNEYKSLYEQALAVIANPSATYQTVVDGLTDALAAANSQIAAAAEASILESTDWWVGLQDLIDAVNRVNALDLDLGVSVSEESLEQLAETQETAEFIVANRSHINQETGLFVWQNLRGQYESLVMDVGSNSRLAKEIAACESLDRTKYTQASWKNLQTQLALAKKITANGVATSNNLSVSTVRRNLTQARTDLREVTWTDELTRLGAWISMCNDLSAEDYQNTEYDRLMVDVRTAVANATTLTNNAKVSSAINNLQNRYSNLVPVDNTAMYRTGNTGILNKKSMPYFITAVILFTGAVAAGAVAGKMRHELRQTQE